MSINETHAEISSLKGAGVGTLDELIGACHWPSKDQFLSRGMQRVIDHTLLKPDARREDVEMLIEEALKDHFYSVCLAPYWLGFANPLLKGSDVHLCSVVGFPLGNHHPQQKLRETEQALQDGAREIDMVINIGALKSNDYHIVEDEIAALAKLCTEGRLLKVILETCLLNENEIVLASKLAMNAGAHFVKTSTGFSTGGATEAAIRLMRQTVGNHLGVKASGGVSDRRSALRMLEAGASRLGSSKGSLLIHS